MNEVDIWERLRAGEQKALEAIYNAHAELLFRYGCKFSTDEALVMDCIHDLFIELWKNHKGLGATTSVKRYLLASIRRKVIKMLNKNKRWLFSDQLENVQFELELAAEDRIIKEEINQEQFDSLQQAFESLSKRQKEVIYLKFYADLDYEDIEDIMGINYQSLRNLVSRALAKMKEKVGLLVFVWFMEKMSVFFEYKKEMNDLFH